MLPFCKTAVLIFICLCLIVIIPFQVQSQETAVIDYYTGAEGSLTLKPFSSKLEYSMPVVGSTTQKTLFMKINKENGPERNLIIPVDANGSFNITWLFKDGPGAYKITFYGNPKANSLRYKGISIIKVTVTSNLPKNLPGLNLNSKIISYVDSVMGKKVGRGECWDLAREALDKNLADWDRSFKYGILLDQKKDEIKPGDIIQFKRVTIKTKTANGTMTETVGMPDHTAVVYSVNDPLVFKLAHQNIGGKKIVVITEMNLINKTAGKFWIYRPVAAAIQ